MAILQLVTPEELQAREQKLKSRGRRGGRRRSLERQQMIDQFKQALQGIAPGYGGDIALGEGEQKRLVRNNLKAAAKELDLHLEFRPTRDPSRISFWVITAEEKVAKPSRGGRPRKEQPQASAESNGEPPPAAPTRRSRRRQKEPEPT